MEIIYGQRLLDLDAIDTIDGGILPLIAEHRQSARSPEISQPHHEVTLEQVHNLDETPCFCELYFLKNQFIAIRGSHIGSIYDHDAELQEFNADIDGEIDPDLKVSGRNDGGGNIEVDRVSNCRLI